MNNEEINIKEERVDLKGLFLDIIAIGIIF